jgi:ribosomal-protein-serine acetyltransferase
MPWAHERYTIAEAQDWIALCQQWCEERSNFEFGIFDGASGAFVGGCGLNKFDRMHGYCNLGYWVRQSCQRRGAATEAIRCLSTFGFAGLSLGVSKSSQGKATWLAWAQPARPARSKRGLHVTA